MKAITACVAMLVGVMAASVPSPASGQTAGMALDQANDNLGYYYHNQYSPWQSFTAGTNGHLAAMQAHVYSTDGANWSATLEIRQGEGASGVLLASQTVTGDGVNRLRTFVLATPVRQTAGGLYTFVFSNASTGLTVRASGNSYAGGRCRNHASYDYNFRTWVLASDWSGEAWRDTSFTASSTVISTAAQLAQFAWLVNNGTTFAGQTIMLAADIDLVTHYWTPIGGDSAPFNGTFDGAGHSVNGLLIDRPGVSHQGLFGVTDSNSAVKNVAVTGFEIRGGDYCGGMIGRAYGEVWNCRASGDMAATNMVGGVVGCAEAILAGCSNAAVVAGANGVGGVVGQVRGSVEDCSNSGPVTGANDLGGVVGYALGDLHRCSNSGTVAAIDGERAGGVAGSCSGASIVECANSGDVSGPVDAGGIVGYAYDGSMVDRCMNNGRVSGVWVGGIAAMSGTGGAVRNCVNCGAVSIPEDVIAGSAGGIVGDTYGDVMNCENSGSVSGSGDEQNLGGLVGWLEDGNFMNCVNYGAVTGTGAIGGVAGRAETGSWIAHCYWKRTVSAPFDVPAFGINNNAGMTMECFSFSDAPGTLSGSVYISGTATFNLAEALKAGMFDGRDTLDIPLRGWTRGSATAYPALITDCWSDPGNFVTNWFDEDASDFTIGSAAELAGLAVLVNGGVSFADKRITLTADIALDAHEWDPIGYLSDGVNPERYFNGLLFDGNGKTISGLYVDDDERRAGGLFGVARDGTILNLGLTDADVSASEEAGILCGHLGKNSIANSFCRGRVRGACAGGIVGAVEGTLMNCWSDARVDGFVSGGLAGRLADPNAFMISGFWMQNGRNYHDLSAVGDYGEAEEANAAECYSFSEPPGQLAVPGEDDPLTLSETLNEVSEGMDGYLGLRWYGWTRGTRWDYPVLTARIRVGGEFIQETLSGGFIAGLTLSEVAAGVAIYTDAHPETTAASFGSLMQQADIMGFTLPELIAGNAILDFSPSLRTTSFNPDAWPLILTFSVANGIDATAVQAMDRLEACWGWSSEILILQMDAPGEEGSLVWPDEVYFGADGTAEAELLPEVYSDKAFFKLLIVPATY